MEGKQGAGEDSPKGGGENDKKVLNIPFEHVNDTIRVELAILLDPSGRNDWHSLAETLGFTAKQINWIPSRRMMVTRGSDTLMMLQDFCRKASSTDTTVGVVMEALETIGRLDALRVLTNHLNEIEDSYKTSSRQAVPDSHCNHLPPTHIKDRRCSEPMDVADTFTSSIDGDVGANVGANVTLDHNYDGVHSAASRESRLCQKCISLTGPSSRSYKSLESEQCSRCSHQLSNQNRDRHNGSHSLNYCRNGMCIPKRESSSLPHEHERIHRQGHHLQCYRAVSPERSLTYPRCKAEQHTHLRSPNNALTPWPSADARMLTVPFHQATTFARVFVTYSFETHKHMQMVLSLCKCLKDNHFPCSLDETAEHFDAGEKHLWVNEKFSSADFVLVCISQKYLDDIDKSPSSPQSLSTAQIYRMMKKECGRGQYHRVVPLLFPGISYAKLPAWMQHVPAIYRWPDEFKNLFFRLMKPESVVNQFVKSRQAKSLNGSTRNPIVYKTASLPHQ